MLLLTTLDAWRSEPDRPFHDESAAYTAEEDAVALANDAFGDEQIVALVVPFSRHPLPGSVDRATVEQVRYARRAPDGRVTAFRPRPVLAEALDLSPCPQGGWSGLTWRTSPRVTAHGGERPTATAGYLLLAPGEMSIWHAVRSDELWLWHRGGPLELTLGGAGERPGVSSAGHASVVLGPEVEEGRCLHALVPAGVWRTARPVSAQGTLVTRVVSPGSDEADVRV